MLAKINQLKVLHDDCETQESRGGRELVERMELGGLIIRAALGIIERIL